MPMVRTTAAAGENIIVCDPKGEIYQRTAAFLKGSGYNIHTINLREPQSGDGWNMLAIPYERFLAGEIDKACEYINDATVSLIPITAKDPYWDYSSRDMLFGLILLLFEICKEKKQPIENVNMRSVLKLREELFCSMDSDEIIESPIWKFARQRELIRIRLNGIIICPENTLACYKIAKDHICEDRTPMDFCRKGEEWYWTSGFVTPWACSSAIYNIYCRNKDNC